MIYLELFLTFLEVGAVSFGGGYAMISLIMEKVIGHGWLSEEQLLSMIAVSESTPGPIAVNMATFVGSSEGGALGALCATLGVVLPSFVIILIIAALIKNFLKYSGVKAFLEGVRPCIVGLILATAVTLFLGTVVGFSGVGESISPDIRGLVILCILVAVGLVWGRVARKKPSPILMIVLSAGLGMLMYSI